MLLTFKEVEKILADCLPGYKMELKTHNRFIYWNGKTYHNLPKHPQIEVGYLRAMGRFFNKEECFKKHL